MLNKPLVKWFLIFIIASGALFAVYAVLKPLVGKPESPKQVLSEDFIKLYSIADSTLIHFPESEKSLLIFFNSECHYCWKEFSEIEENVDKLSGVEVFFFSIEPISKIGNFVGRYEIIDQKNFHFAKIDPRHQAEVFGHLSLPSVFIYRDGKLVKELDGKKKFAEILQALD